MSDTNLEHKTVKFIVEKKAAMLSEKYNTWVITEYAISIKDLFILKLPSGESI